MTKEQVLFLLNTLIELIQTDRVRVEEIADLTNSEILELARKKVESNDALLAQLQALGH